MKKLFRPFASIFPLCAAAIFIASHVGALHAQSGSVWKGGTGRWSDSTFWNNGVPNSSSVEAFIDGGDTNVNSVVNVDGGFTVGALTLDIGDVINITNNAGLTLVGTGQFAGAGTFANSGSVTLAPGNLGALLTLSGNVTLSGGGTITLVPGSQLDGDNATLTNVDNTIAGYSGGVGNDGVSSSNLTILNGAAGVINANVSGRYLTVAPRGGTVTNAGLMEASNGGLLDLDGSYGATFTNTGAGAMQALDGSVVLVRGSNVVGGTLSTSGNGLVQIDRGGQDAGFTNVTSAGSLFVDGTVDLTGTFTNSGSITFGGSVGNGGGTLYTVGDVTLNGAGLITMTPGSGITGDGNTLTNVDNTIQGFSNLGSNAIAIVNGEAGVIDANVSGQTLNVDPGDGGLTNAGLMEASDGGILFLSGNYNQTFTNQGEFRVNDGSTINASQGIITNYANNTLAGGTYTVLSTGNAATTLNLGGGSITANAATVTLSGVNSVFAEIGALADNQGTFSLFGLRQFTTVGALTNEGTLDLDAGCTLHVAGSLTCSGTSTLLFGIGGTASQGEQSPGILQVNGSTTLAGNLAVIFSEGASLPGAADTLTVFSGNGTVGGAFANVANGARLATADGIGSFEVDYGAGSAHATSVILKNFVMSPLTTPTISSFSPTSGKVNDTVVIKGTGFVAPLAVTFAGASATVGSFSFTRITVQVPPRATTGPITVTTSYGSVTSAASFSLIPPPPVITGAASANGTVGKPFTYGIAATNQPTSYEAYSLPAGLGLNTRTGVISGTPTAAGTTTVTVRALNVAGAGTAAVNLTIVEAPPVITSTTTVSVYQGQPFSYGITATNQPTSFGAQGLPAGLIFRASSGVIAGTPTVFGTFNVTLSATNGAGAGSAILTLTVVQPAPVVTSATTATTTEGQPFSYRITGTNQPTGYSVSGLPAGLGFNNSTGVISGTPTVAGTFAVTVGAANGTGTGTATLNLTITPVAPVITSAASASGTVGTTFSDQIAAVYQPTSYSTSVLPAGLSVNSSTGVISGTPTTPGNFSVTIHASNSTGTGTATLALTIAAAAPVVTSAGMATATEGTPFSFQITAGNNPASFGASGLPAGLSVNGSTGVISGTPTVAGTFPVTVNASNSTGTGSATLTLTVTAVAPVITSATNASGTVGSPFSYQVTAIYNPTGFSARGLPGGLSFNASTGAIAGTPTAAGMFTVALSASNGAGVGQATLTLTVAAIPPVITSATTATLTQGVPFSYQITATNNPTQYSAGGLPAGLTLNPTTGMISGTTTVAGTFPVSLAAGNSSGSGSATLTLTVVAPVLVESTLYNFSATGGQAAVVSNLVQSKNDGNFYGTAASGNYVFRITPAGVLTVLYTFSNPDGTGSNANGSSPQGGLVQGNDGNFYGTTVSGGSKGAGTVYKITPAGALTTLHTFVGTAKGAQDYYGPNPDGSHPYATLVQSTTDGNFYGTTRTGGTSGYGTVFKMTPTGTLTTLYNFSAISTQNSPANSDGAEPESGLVQGSDGSFYGTTVLGSPSGAGTVFNITSAGVLKTLHSFVGFNHGGTTDGADPVASLILATDKNFYGTTSYGGTGRDGTVFKITPTGVFTTVYNFTGSDGFDPFGGVIQAQDGNFYGTTANGGAHSQGTVFRLTPAGVETVLYSFTLPVNQRNTDGNIPNAGLVQGTDGTFYGACVSGGTGGNGTIFKLSAASSSPSAVKKVQAPLEKASNKTARRRSGN